MKKSVKLSLIINGKDIILSYRLINLISFSVKYLIPHHTGHNTVKID